MIIHLIKHNAQDTDWFSNNYFQIFNASDIFLKSCFKTY